MLDTIINFVKFVLQLFKSDIKVTIARTILSSGLLLVIGGPIYSLSVTTEKMNLDLKVVNDTGDILFYLGFILIIIGVFLLISIYKSVKIHPYLYFSPSLSNMNEEMPIYAVENQDKYSIKPQKIGPIKTYIKNEIIEDYNYMKKNFEKRIDHSESNKIYMAVIGSFPYMYLMGTLLRNGHIKSIIMEYSNRNNRWKRLDSYGTKASNEMLDSTLTISNEIFKLANNNSQDVGIALCYTFEIFKNTIDSPLKEDTLFIKNSLGIGHYFLNNEETQESLIDELLQYIHQLSQNGKRVHLFVAAQASFCVNLGKRYQDNATGTIVLHNYDNDKKRYTWEIEFNKGNIK